MPEDSQFEKIISVDNLRKAWIKAYQYARTEDIFFDEYAYSVFAEHLESRLLDLSRELSDGSYRPSPLRYITIPKGKKERKIYFLSPKDTVVIQAVINIIGSDFESTFIKESFGNRLNVDFNESKDVYQSWQEKYSEYVATVRGFVRYGLSSWYLITDIENYYPSISQDWLIGLISTKVDIETLNLIEYFIRNNVLDSKEEIEPLTGIPAGVIYSHFFSNIYLNDFDHRAKDITLGYARYVDDICLICGSLEELEYAKKELSDYLERWKQKFKEFEKTTTQPIFNIEPLLEHTRKMKYAVRLDVVETYEESPEAISMVQETEKPFYRLYKIAEREGDLGQIVNQAGLVISLLKRSGDVDLVDIIYSLLETHPIRPATLKAALVYLLEMEHPKPSQKFLDFFFGKQKRPDYISTFFLQLLPYFNWEVEFTNEILYLCKNDPSYLVRSTAFVALSKMAKELDSAIFDEILSQEKSIYVSARLISCFPLIPKPVNAFKLLGTLNDEFLSVSAIRAYIAMIVDGSINKDIINTLWAHIKDNHFSFELLCYFFYLASIQGFYWVVEEICSTSYRSRILLVASSLSLEVINELTNNSEIIQLVSFADQVRKMGFVDTALIGYFEASGKKPSDQLKSDISIAVKNVEVSAGLPPWISDSTTTRERYKLFPGDQDYLCQYLDDGNGKKAILEIISFERIKSGGFLSYEEWSSYLVNLSNSNVVPKVHLGKYSDTKFACLYEIPDGYSTVANIMAGSFTKDSLSQSKIFLLSEKILEYANRFQVKNFHIHTIDPLSVLWNPISGNVLLLGIGASLGAGKYHCGIHGCKTPYGEEEMGVSATVYNFGLFVFQLLLGGCSLEQIKNVSSKYSTIKISDLLSKLDILPHYKMILGRLLNPDPDKRYGSMQNLMSDFGQANKFKFELEDLNNKELPKPALILVDFVSFRLRVISRNPNLKSDSSIWRSRAIVDELANTLQFLPDDLLKYWRVGLESNHEDIVFPQPKDIRNISLEGKRLIDVAYGWEKLCKQYRLKESTLTPLSRVFLYRCIVIEAMSSFSGFMGALSVDQEKLVKNHLIGFSEFVDGLIGTVDGEKEITVRVNGNDYAVNLSKKDLFEIRQLSIWRTKTSTSHDAISSLKVLGLFWALARNKVEVVSDNEVIMFNSPVSIKNNSFLDEKTVWTLLNLLPALDEQIDLFQNLFDDKPSVMGVAQNDVWFKYLEVQFCLMKLNLAKRIRANVCNHSG